MPVFKRKVFAYITSGNRLLVFWHPDAPEAGTQVPAGTVEPGERPEAAVLREAFEETSLPGLELAGLLGERCARWPILASRRSITATSSTCFSGANPCQRGARVRCTLQMGRLRRYPSNSSGLICQGAAPRSSATTIDSCLSEYDVTARDRIATAPSLFPPNGLQARLDSRNRAWSLTKGAKLSGVEQIARSFILADVVLDPAERYCANVRRWAEHLLADTEELARRAGSVRW